MSRVVVSGRPIHRRGGRRIVVTRERFRSGAECRRDPDGFWSRQPLVVASLALARQPTHCDRLKLLDYDLPTRRGAVLERVRLVHDHQLSAISRSAFLLLLSATPVGNDLTELYNLILLLKPGLLSTDAQFRRAFGRIEALAESSRREKLRGLLREVMVRNTRAHLDVRLPRRLAATHVVQPGPDEAEALACLTRVIRERYEHANVADRWRLMTLHMQAGSSPAALRYGLRNDANGNHAGGADAFACVLEALDRVTVPAKTAALIDLIQRSAGSLAGATR